MTTYREAHAFLAHRRERATVRGAVLALHRRKQATIGQALDRLRELQLGKDAAVILNEIDRTRLIGANIHLPDLIEEALGAIDGIAPIWYEMALEDFYEVGSILCLYPECRGFPMGWDDWEEMTEDPASWTRDLSLYLFFTMIRLGNKEGFLQATEHFGWEVDFPSLCDEWDWKKLDTVFERAGLGYFTNALDAIFYQTGNVYFDFNPYDENVEYDDLPRFNLEGVRDLKAAWRESEPIHEDLERASREFAVHPELAVKLIDCLERCQVYTYTARPNQTLAELWGDERNQVRIRL